MKRVLTLLCALLLLVSCLTVGTAAETAKQPTVNSEAAIVVDAETGVTLYQRNETKQLAPADSAQIMTALLALESGKANETITVTKEIAATFDKKGTNIPLAVGDEVKMIDLVYAMMLGSNSDAAKTIAVAVSGSEKTFAEKMTARIQQITGTKSSTFANADGEPSDGNRTTAKDLALLVREAMKNDEFRTVFGTTAYTMPAPNANSSERPFSTICMLMRNNDMNVKYDDTVGGKSGWNKDAKYTLVSAAQRDGRTLICVVLGASESKQRYQETIALFDYIFATFRNVEIPTSLLAPTEIDVVKDGKVVRKIVVSIPEGTKLSTNTEFREGTMAIASSLPKQVQEGETNITLTVSAKDQNGITVVLGSVILNVETRAPETESPPANDENLGGQTEKKKSFGAKLWDIVKSLLLFLLYVILAIVLLALVLFVMSYVQRKKRQARRKRRREEQAATGNRHAAPTTGRRHKEIAEAEKPEEDSEESVEETEEEYEF
ncbi:MAG: D-alanyl-D-alanine carboxypeptidase [Clostridia bacterium]|nr:D-alanyl-D-alanine carboxypeptidase [Clostridia bacterium]